MKFFHFLAQHQLQELMEKIYLTKSLLTNPSNETLLISTFEWLIIDQIYNAALLGGLKANGCMGKVQGSVTLSQ